MRSRIVPLTVTYWGQSTTGPVLLDSLAEEQLFPQFDRVRWHRWLADGSGVLLDGERLHRVQPSGESRLLATVGAPHVNPRLSPDGRWVAVALERSITLVPTDGGAVKRLPQPGWVHSIGWHPDSKRLALSAGNRIRVCSTGGMVETLYTEPIVHRSSWWDGPAILAGIPQTEWSADGALLACRFLFSENHPRDGDYEAQITVLRGRKVEAVVGGYGADRECLLSWAPAEPVLAWTKNGGEPDTWCHLWSPRGEALIATSGTVFSYAHTSWQPGGHLLAVERVYSHVSRRETFGVISAPSDFEFFDVRSRGASPRDDGWPEFQWSARGDMFCARQGYGYVEEPLPAQPTERGVDIGDCVVIGSPVRGQQSQATYLGCQIGEPQWRAGQRDVTFVRTVGRESRLHSARVERGRGGPESARRWLAKGKRALRRDAIEEAAVCFRNAVRCAGMWAEPRVRLARCYSELSKRERNPACMAWLLWGAEWEMQQAARWQRLSNESRRFWGEVSARRERICSALGLGLPQPGANLSIRKPDQPIGGKR